MHEYIEITAELNVEGTSKGSGHKINKEAILNYGIVVIYLKRKEKKPRGGFQGALCSKAPQKNFKDVKADRVERAKERVLTMCEFTLDTVLFGV